MGVNSLKNITIITDTWDTVNVNGVVTYLTNIKFRLEAKGFRVTLLEPGQFSNLPLPTYPEIKMALSTRSHMIDIIKASQPDFIHISTEGTLALSARLACLKNKWQFTTFYHTRLPEYARLRFKPLGKPAEKYMKWFHTPSACVMVSTETLKQELTKKGFNRLAVSPYGVDLELFHKNPTVQVPKTLQWPVFVFMGRIAPEKNLEAFLDCDLPGSKLVIGSGPSKEALKQKYHDRALFVGHQNGQQLVDLLSVGDVSIFPSRTDTFGLAIIEALACGLPVAAYNVQGPRNILTNGYDGFMGDDLQASALNCLKIDRANCVETAKRYGWDQAVTKFLENLIPVCASIEK